ncbi:4Fe-4S dicluster domain-containing protein [Fuchsiella alkaliacetigena]|uniref:4Fe-4S dicluster domain-containing protein n=1 Tax=Fuchsiella alkaliacetigena TaxID=957042 RepID=UPI00200A5015|nr:4Fe-4S dicluster domain-containing protein [Fuchsiella alkaliacetigena]MCK8824771.1 4Fe-4S dicluster domain-containing protein [Fuchsiella alkaliacetigena]
MKRIYAKEEYCLGCKLCEVYCVTSHSASKDIIKAHKLESITPRLIIESSDNLSFALQCRHCDEADCTRACITGAMQKDEETGVVNYDEERCVGCWTCIMACSFGVIRREQAGKKVIAKCDLCIEEEAPACVTNCPNDALVLAERAEEEGVQ